MTRTRTAVIGFGHFGGYHAQKLHNTDMADLVAIVDADAERVRAAAEKYGASVHTDYTGLVGSVDAVIVAVPTAGHYDIARFFLDNGVDVLVEKPMTSTVEQAEDLIRRAREGGRILQVGHLERFFSSEIGLLQQVRDPLYIEALRIMPFKPRGSDVSVVLDLMIHDIDLISALVGAPLKTVDAVGASVLSDSEDIVNARLVFESGCVAAITTSRIASKSERKIRIFQSDSVFSVDLLERRIKKYNKTETEDGPNIDVAEEELGERDALRAEVDGFLQAVADRSTPLVTGEDGRDALITAMRVIEGIAEHRKMIEARSGTTAATAEAMQ